LLAQEKASMRPANSRASASVRRATLADLPAIVAMRDDLNDLERSGCPHAPIQRMNLEQFTAVWGKTFDDSDHCWRLVEVNQRPVGFGLIYLVSPRLPPLGAYVHWAYLAPDYRRQGLGQLLLDDLVGWARSRGVERVELQYIEGNQGAQQFWTKTGFRPYARKCVHYLGATPSPSASR
jgi:GNAT superfamily N-acetyltransferase